VIPKGTRSQEVKGSSDPPQNRRIKMLKTNKVAKVIRTLFRDIYKDYRDQGAKESSEMFKSTWLMLLRMMVRKLKGNKVAFFIPDKSCVCPGPCPFLNFTWRKGLHNFTGDGIFTFNRALG
jgi:hypothetical protein